MPTRPSSTPKSLSGIHRRILEVMRQHPEGITEGQIREKLGIPAADQANFGRRRRDLYSYYRIDKKKAGREVLYVYVGPLETPKDTHQISQRMRAQVLHAARGRCGMCGRSVQKHGIALVADHKVPREWGGKTEAGNLWALCEECNSGKKNYFRSVDSDEMREVMRYKSVHMRLGETLKAFQPNPVPAVTLEFVANQDDWKKRVRELRYLGWQIRTFNRKLLSGRVSSNYQLLVSKPWPADPTAEIRRYERQRAENNKALRGSAKTKSDPSK